MAYPHSHPQHFGFDDTNNMTYGARTLAYHENDNMNYHPSLNSALTADDDMSNQRHASLRKDSCTTNSGVLSPAESSGWGHKNQLDGYETVLMPSAPSSSASNALFPTASNPFVPQQQHYYVNNGETWAPFEQNQGHQQQGLDDYADTKYEPSPFPTFDQDARRDSSFSLAGQEQGYDTPASLHPVQSPQSHQEWQAMAAGMEREDRKPSRRLQGRTDSPEDSKSTRDRSFKGDGIRKKNAKIDIPDDRNVQRLDQLIASSTNDEEIREFKAQKRLLRNREAALASRQRKKQHTADLETKNRELLSEIVSLRNQLDKRSHDCLALQRQTAFVEKQFEALTRDHQELVIKHTQETSYLRQKLNFYTEHLEHSPAPPMSAAASSTGFSEFNSELEGMHLGTHPIDMSHSFVHVNYDNDEWHGESPSYATICPSKPFATPGQPASAKQPSNEQPIASGILFMLLLCGAFVASNSASSRPVIPRMPDNVRAASHTVLNSLLKESKTDVATGLQPSTHVQPFAAPATPQASWQSSAHSDNQMAAMHQELTSPTKAQQADQLFAMTPAQYNSLTQPVDTSAQRPVPKRNLAEILNNMREEDLAKNGLPKMYTQSLLWDQVPADVVRQFKQAVSESERPSSAAVPEGNGQAHSSMPVSDTYGYNFQHS